MKSQTIIQSIEKILSLIDEYKIVNPQHEENCNFLKEKYLAFKMAAISESNLQEYIEWNRWFAPRIIFEGINDKTILSEVENLNNLPQ